MHARTVLTDDGRSTGEGSNWVECALGQSERERVVDGSDETAVRSSTSKFVGQRDALGLPVAACEHNNTYGIE